MNYKKHYDTLIERSPKERPVDDYYEKHRIVPGCMGGKYEESNVVWLTPEEHFVAHQLLYKIYKHPKLLYAINMMTIHDSNNRNNNKRYYWMRKKFLENHPNKSKEGREKLSLSMMNYYSSDTYKKKSIESKSRYREERSCDCGCGQKFTVYKKDKKRYINNSHANKMRDYSTVSEGMKKALAKLSTEELKLRMEKSVRTCDNVKRGLKISQGKKGKQTNQQYIMGKRYASMSQYEFDLYLESKNPKMHNRMINLRNKYIK